MKMIWLSFRRILTAALVAVTCVQANPFVDSSLARRDTYVPQQCTPLVVGATSTPAGTVCVTLSSGTLIITYTLTSGGTFNDIHAWVGTQVPTTSVPGDVPGHFPYTLGNGKCTLDSTSTVATCTVTPIPDSWRSCTGKLYVVAHAGITGGSTGDGTGWGNGPCYDTKGNCAKYFTVDEQCQCSEVISYPPVTSTTICTITITTTSTTKISTTYTPAPTTTSSTCTNAGPGIITITSSTTTPVVWTCPAAPT